MSADSAVLNPRESPGAATPSSSSSTEDCARVRSLDGYEVFRLTHIQKEGCYYIVHDGAVLDEPLPSRDIALQLLRAMEQEGFIVNWAGILIIEAGNEWGQRNDPTPRRRKT